MTVILGISAFYHDSAAALIIDGKIVCAAQEERFTRKKHDATFPKNAIQFCLDYSNLSLDDIEYISFYDKPFLKFERLLETYIANAPKGLKSFCTAMPIWLREKLFLKKMLLDNLKGMGARADKFKILFAEHHLSHAASAFYPSPFEDAVILTVDGVGEWATTTVCIGKGKDITIKKEIHFPHSLGLLYSAFTYYLGFKVNSGEYKVMGLAPYGHPKHVNKILDHLIDVKDDGSFRLDQNYFDYASGLKMINQKFEQLFGRATRKPEEDPLSQFHMDIAASLQLVTEIVLLKMTKHLRKEYGLKNLCLAGGVALNCVANGKILEESGFERVWAQPAAGDAGGALGVALATWHKELQKPRTVKSCDNMNGSYLGPEFDESEIIKELKTCEAVFETLSETNILEEVARELSEGKAVGWFQGRMEFGPRALGNRSILGDPSSDKMQKILNLKIKYRESFRPFAPAILADELKNWFELSTDSPYMLLVTKLKRERRIAMSIGDQSLFGIDKLNVKRSSIPAVTHVDYSARVQTVHKKTNKKFYSLIERFMKITEVPILVNTSFNVRGEPIVCTPTDAFNCFMGTGLDLLVIGNQILRKSDQKSSLLRSYENLYDLD